MNSLIIQIGSWKMEFGVLMTNAPIDYDYRMTMTLKNVGGENPKRIVLVAIKDLEYQKQRYISGNFSAIPTGSDVDSFEELIINKIFSKE